MKNKEIKVSDFTEYPGPRYRYIGPYSGEQFREEILVPAIKESGDNVSVNLDGVMGYGSSFLEEVFGGAVRGGIDLDVMLKILEHSISKDDPSIKIEIDEYVRGAMGAAEALSAAEANMAKIHSSYK